MKRMSDQNSQSRPPDAVKLCGFRALGAVLLLCVGLVMIVLLAGREADARVRGKCRDCHSMHAKDATPGMTNGSCLDCHGRNPAGEENIITVGKMRIPQVIHRKADGDLAAGNFAYVADMFSPNYSSGHNIAGLTHAEFPPMDMPPGFEGNVIMPNGFGPMVWPQQQQVNCAGTWGCHGDRTVEDPYKAMSGAHHEDDRVIDGSTVGKSFRFLLGVKGVEHKDWEYLATVDDHNGYKGDMTHNERDTISYLCGQCHSKFHPNPYQGGAREVGTAYYTPWTRHPADISFSAMHTAYAGSEYQNFVKYSLEVPVGFHEPTGKEDTVNINSVVICQSCHRSHASPYPDALRWDYDRMLSRSGAAGTGCLTCHTRKGNMGLLQ
ncbi:MAG: hypothetical protein OHK006_15360 [Thermodesulfovibrionales bacterium]